MAKWAKNQERTRREFSPVFPQNSLISAFFMMLKVLAKTSQKIER
ncbi:hypothetical protein [Vibrio navarrensis]|nr:hypothetical protein [Vibrio navarrensis]